MTPKEKELIAVAGSIAAGCEYCTIHHVKAARLTGATDGELAAMIGIALGARDSATRHMVETARREAGIDGVAPATDFPGSLPGLAHLAETAAALALNAGPAATAHLSKAIKAGADGRDGEVALALARKIRRVAAEKADGIAGESCGCGESSCAKPAPAEGCANGCSTPGCC